jgi:hypothetical protein
MSVRKFTVTKIATVARAVAITTIIRLRFIIIAAVPLLWAVNGASAAFLLDVRQDWGLLVAAIVWIANRITVLLSHGA